MLAVKSVPHELYRVNRGRAGRQQTQVNAQIKGSDVFRHMSSKGMGLGLHMKNDLRLHHPDMSHLRKDAGADG